MKLSITVQNTIDSPDVPDRFTLKRWISEALEGHCEHAEVCIRIVGTDESSKLNYEYRHKPTPTNILSFPIESFDDVEITDPYLGDLVICPDVLKTEAQECNVSLHEHWAHIVVHGVLHLLGYDHITDEEAEEMEFQEIEILDRLGFANPYQE